MLLAPACAQAAPTSGQVDFISRMGQNGYVVEQGGYVFYAHKNAIWRMFTTGTGQKKQYTLHAPFDLQNHGGNVYFIDRDGSKYTLYRFYPGDAKPKKLLDDVYDAVIGGDILYYVNSAGDTMHAWNLRTGKSHRIYHQAFTKAHDLNYMQGLLTFTARINGTKKDSLVLYSPDKNHATYYEGLASAGLRAQGSYIYMPYEGGILRAKFSAAAPSLSSDKVMVKSAAQFLIVGGSFLYWKEEGNAVRVVRRNISSGEESEYFGFDKTKLRNVTLQPTASAVWVYTEDRQGAYYKQRLGR